MEYLAHEIDQDTHTATGVIESYVAKNAAEAVAHLLYTRRLSDGQAKLSASGFGVHSGTNYWVVSMNWCLTARSVSFRVVT